MEVPHSDAGTISPWPHHEMCPGVVSALSSAQTYSQLSQFNGANEGTPIAPLDQGFNGDL